MSDIDITPGFTFTDSTPLTPANLNAAASPTASISAGTVTATDVLNYFRDADFNKYAIKLDLSQQVGSTKEFISRFWSVQVDGGTITAVGQDVNDDTEMNGRGAYGLKLAYVSGTPTTVDLSQFIPQAVCQELYLSSFTVGFYCYNNTGASVTPSLRVSTANAANGSGAVTFDSAHNMTACPNGAWTLCTVTVDGTSLGANTVNGLQLTVRLPSTLNSASEEWWFQKAQLVIGSDANTSPPRQFLNPFIPMEYFCHSENAGTDGGASSSSTVQLTINTHGDPAWSGVGGDPQLPNGIDAKINGTTDGITLSPGVYWVKYSAPFAHASNSIWARCVCKFGGSQHIQGRPAQNAAGEECMITGEGLVNAQASGDLTFEHTVETTQASTGLGRAKSAGIREVYLEVSIWKLSDPV